MAVKAGEGKAKWRGLNPPAEIQSLGITKIARCDLDLFLGSWALNIIIDKCSSSHKAA